MRVSKGRPLSTKRYLSNKDFISLKPESTHLASSSDTTMSAPESTLMAALWLLMLFSAQVFAILISVNARSVGEGTEGKDVYEEEEDGGQESDVYESSWVTEDFGEGLEEEDIGDEIEGETRDEHSTYLRGEKVGEENTGKEDIGNEVKEVEKVDRCSVRGCCRL